MRNRPDDHPTLGDVRELERERRRSKRERQVAKKRGNARRKAREDQEARELDRTMRDYGRVFKLALPFVLLIGTAIAA